MAWRTVLTVIVVTVLQLFAFIYACNKGMSAEMGSAFAAFCLWSTGAAASQAAKASVEHLANGGGVKGAVAALTTNAKPGA